MRMVKKFIWMALLGLMACGAADTEVPVTVQFPSMAKSVLTSLSKAVLSVTASDITTVSSSQNGPFSSSVSFSVNVPTGSSRAFTATAAITGTTTLGYQGTSTTDVSTSTTSVPLTMLFVNFANNSASAVSGGPQITAISASYSSTAVTLTIDFGSAITAQNTALIIEFIPASGGTARSQSIINEAKGSVSVTMPSAGTDSIIVNGLSATSLDPILYNASDQSATLSASDLSATLGSSTQVTITMSRTAFTSNIDSSIAGTLNILAGSKSGASTVVTPSNLSSSFTASSSAVSTTGGNVMKYNASFDTSSL